MKLIIFLIGVVLSVWVGVIVYTPTQAFVTDIKEIYLKSKATQRTISQKSEATINTITESYKEIARVFGMKVAEESIKEDITTPTPAGTKDPIEQLFTHNIALWIATATSFMTLSLYVNVLSFFAFFLKPVTFLIKK
ncbi:hypothetical protein H6768_05895 [Candidatus Peribacteria bacterium]|nr:hypothetical protein [Candidatus Peribacteria bacterium]